MNFQKISSLNCHILKLKGANLKTSKISHRSLFFPPLFLEFGAKIRHRHKFSNLGQSFDFLQTEKMETFEEQFDQITTLLSSNKLLAYSTLLHLQQQSGADPSLVKLLADSSSIIVSYIISDVSDNDEEM